MGGERGALEGIEPHHRSRENGLECSDHLSIGTDICKYLDYGNVFWKQIIETLTVNKGRVVSCIMIEWGEIQTTSIVLNMWFIAKAPLFCLCPLICSSPWYPCCSGSGHSPLNVLLQNLKNFSSHATSSTCSAATVSKQPPHQPSSCPI